MMQEWFEKAKLGIFIHYGIYAVGDVSESWSFHNGHISYEDYMKQCEGFTAAKYDPAKWAELFRKAGAQYVILTAKHHDGVALFDTKYSDLSVVKKTPAARDLVAEYVKAVRQAGLKVGLYYSLIDWSDPRYRSVYPEGCQPGDCLEDIYGTPAGGEEDPARWEEFLRFNDDQLRELMTGYGTVDLLWFDGDWERSARQWNMPRFREYLHSLNQDVVLNSRLRGYGDYETPEQGIPLYGPKGVWEFCTTINDSWGYRPSDKHYKSSGQIIRMFCDCLTLGGKMLLDVGPKEDGTLDERQEKVLLDLGAWIHANEEAVYGTGKGLDYRHYLGGSTLSADRKTVYLFVYDSPREMVCVKGIGTPVKQITVLHTGEKLRFDYTGAWESLGMLGTLWIEAAGMSLCPFVTVLKMELTEEITYRLGHGEVMTENSGK
ncbi:MAG: alpha-L-fucosidase [Clostridium sp.]|nr:alpha-L-fucosidase [Clostridium sp.]